MPHPAERDRTLRKLRFIWAALLAHLVALGIVALVMQMDQPPPPSTGALRQRLAYLYIALFCGAAIAYFARMQCYKRHWQGDSVTPRGYFLGNVILFAILDTVATFAIVFYMIGDNVVPMIFPAAVVAALLALNFPNGGPMVPYRGALQ